MYEVALHEETLRQVRADLGLPDDLKVGLCARDTGILNAVFNGDKNEVILYYGHARNRYQTPVTTKIQLTRSLLHELRHAWQLKEWGVEKFVGVAAAGAYKDHRREHDAREWAEKNLSRYKHLVVLVPARGQRPPRRLP